MSSFAKAGIGFRRVLASKRGDFCLHQETERPGGLRERGKKIRLRLLVERLGCLCVWGS